MARSFSGRRMTKEWNGTLRSTQAFTSDAQTLILGAVSFLIPATVLRMIGEYTIGNGTAGVTAGDQCAMTIAIAKVATDAFTLGATAMPDPSVEPQYPWLFWRSHALWWNVSETASGGGAATTVRQGFDVKTMRKIKPSETLVVVAQYEDLAGLPPVQVAMGPVRVFIGT